MQQLVMKYRTPAEDSTDGWERYSLPIGNGYIGANVFGIVKRDRIQITENSLQNPQYGEPNGVGLGGLNNFAEIYIEFEHECITGYERGLSLNSAVAYCKYCFNGAEYRREYIASYPDKAVLINITADRDHCVSFKIRAEIPFVKDYSKCPGDGGGKSGKTAVDGNIIILKGKMHFYNIQFEGQVKVISDGGEILSHNDCIEVKLANSATIIIAAGTSYKLCPEVFLEKDPQKKAMGEAPGKRVSEIVNNITDGYAAAKQRHIDDYSALFGRVNVEIGNMDCGFTCEEMLKRYANGERISYLEVLYFQYGRYLLISSSRTGGLPANLQGIWNCHDHSPWGSGYWHNINVQMNYWPAFNTNLIETFAPYVEYWKAYLPKVEQLASEYIRRHHRDNYIEGQGKCGWTIGTGSYPYVITEPSDHSGPGTGALTSKLFWEYYDFTRDKNILARITYPALLGMSRFLTKTVREIDGEYLTMHSASPEQINPDTKEYIKTIGCAFDQQMIFENGKDFLKVCEILGIDDDDARIQKKQQESYNPVSIGASGQIKEFREESFYGAIGEYRHRHISHLMGLYPGTIINSDTPEWLEAARYTLNERGNNTTGWGLAHRLNAWARTGDGNKAYEVFRILLATRTYPNLWDACPPFQIDGNLGGTAGFAEMLLQSHEGFISILPALPDAWEKGSFEGLTARGGFEVSVDWLNKQAVRITVKSNCGETIRIRYPEISKYTIKTNGKITDFQKIHTDLIEFNSKKGDVFQLTN